MLDFVLKNVDSAVCDVKGVPFGDFWIFLHDAYCNASLISSIEFDICDSIDIKFFDNFEDPETNVEMFFDRIRFKIFYFEIANIAPLWRFFRKVIGSGLSFFNLFVIDKF